MPLAFPTFSTRRTDAITIAASTWRWDGVSGAVLVSSGFPLRPGQVTAANLAQVRVFVGGTEQAVALQPLDGRFPDGAYRSIGIQFQYSLTHNTPVTAEVRINQGSRGTVDVPWVEPTWATHVTKKAVIAPTDPAHLCATFVTLAPLTPATNDAGVAATWATEAVARWTGNTTTGASGKAGTAIYDHPTGLWAMYCRTGTRSWYQWAYDWACELLGGSVLDAGGEFLQLLPYVNPTVASRPCTNEATWNPETLTGNNSSCGGPNEQYSTRWIAMSTAYWMTAWRQPKRNLDRQVINTVRDTTDYPTMRDRWMYVNGWPRYNISTSGIMTILVGYLTGCTSSFSIPGGIPGPATFDYATWLPWTIDALEYYTWNTGDFRDGLVGIRSGLPYDAGYGSTNFANFQLALVAEYLMLYYDTVSPDPRIPALLQTMASYMIGQTRAATAIDNATYPGHVWTGPYICTREEAVADPTFTATGSLGGNTLTWVSGTYTPADFFTNFPIEGPGIPAGSRIATTVGTTLTLLSGTLTSGGSRTVSTPGSGWWIAMMPSLFAWVYAYTGNALYATWRDRAADTGSMMTGMETKNWGEWFGGTRQAYLYYAHGGTVRGRAGVHPTAIVNPPPQPELG